MITGNFDEFIAAVKAEEARLMAQINQWYRKTVFDIAKDIVVSSPQYSGNLAANWRLGLNGASADYDQINLKGDESDWYLPSPYIRGDNPAVGNALAFISQALDTATFRDLAVVSNNTPYADEVEQGLPPPGRTWRPGNLIDGRVAMVTYIYEKYK